jgi:hypothetical protein
MQLQEFKFNDNDWFIADDVAVLPKNGVTPYHGFVYAIEFGGLIKIGHSTKLQNRIKTLKSQGKNYSNVEIGRIIFSAPHTNSSQNEKVIHKYLGSKRVNGGELFNLNMDQFMSQLPVLVFEDTSQQKIAKSESFFNSMKDFVGGVR